MIALSTTAGMLAAMRSARRIEFSSYFLPAGVVERALEAAAGRGAAVQVRLEGYLWGGASWMRADNADAVRRLRAAGADAKLVHMTDQDGPSLHLKAAVVDSTAYLADCNWSANDIVIRDDTRAHVAAIRSAASWKNGTAAGALKLTKGAAIASEVRMLRTSRNGTVDVESEALRASRVSGALRALAQKGVHCRVLIAQRAAADAKTRTIVASLEKAGVDVRAVRSNDKYAISNGAHVWIGSADATSTYRDADRIDWGLPTSDPRIVKALQARFNANWERAKAIP